MAFVVKKSGGKRRKQLGFGQQAAAWLGRMTARRRPTWRKKTVKPALSAQPRINWRVPLALVGAPCAAALFVLVCWGAFRGVSRWNIFELTEVRLVGARVVTEGQVRHLAGLERGVNLLTLDAREAEAKIAAHPWVAEVRVKKQWPAGVTVRLHEYTPFALINQAGTDGEARLSYIDYSGHVIAEAREGGALDYPVINGVGPADVTDGRLVREGRAGGALQLLHLAGRGNALLPLQSVSEVRLDDEKGLVMFLADHPFPIRFGTERLKPKFGELLRALHNLYNSGDIERVVALEMEYGDDVNKMLCRLALSR